MSLSAAATSAPTPASDLFAEDSDGLHRTYSGRTPMVTIHEASRAPSSSRGSDSPKIQGPITNGATALSPDFSSLKPPTGPEFTSAPSFHLVSTLDNTTPPSPPKNPATPTLAPLQTSEFETPTNPFNFESVQYSAGRAGSATKSKLGRRQGHKYKHSSVSHQAMLDVEHPPNRAPLQIPASLPVPTFSEFRSSMNPDQKRRALWCFGHFAVAGWILWLAHTTAREKHEARAFPSLSPHRSHPISLPVTLTVLSHLLFFDAFGAVLCVMVDVASNFEVWSRSSIAFPFGLRRLELLSSLSMGVGLLFMGFDLISHSLSHSLESHSREVPEPEKNQPGEIWVFGSVVNSLHTATMAAIVATLISASLLGNHARIGKAMRSSGGVSPHSGSALGRFISRLPGVLSNPSHLLTLSCSAVILVLSTFFSSHHSDSRGGGGGDHAGDIDALFDNLLAVGFAGCMVLLGGRLCLTLGKILLMSFPTSPTSPPAGTKFGSAASLLKRAAHPPESHVSDVIQSIRSDPAVVELEDARFWQVHYELAMANIRLSMPRHRQLEVPRLRERIATLIRNRLSGGYGDSTAGLGGKGFRWEVSVEVRLVD